METQVAQDLQGIVRTLQDIQRHVDRHIEAAQTVDRNVRAREWAAAAGAAVKGIEHTRQVVEHLLVEFPADWTCEGCGRDVYSPDLQVDPEGGRWHPACLQLFRCHVSDGVLEDEAFDFLRRRLLREVEGSGGAA